jgi:hypothetical protein
MERILRDMSKVSWEGGKFSWNGKFTVNRTVGEMRGKGRGIVCVGEV